jgi:hypothetical protein
MRAAWLAVLVTAACGGAGGGTTTTAHQTQSLAFRGDECRTIWHRLKDASGADLPWESADASGNSAWTKGEGIEADAKREKQALEAICFDSHAKDQTVERYLRTDDRRFDFVAAALLVDECVESGRCDADPMMAGLVAWYARKLELTKLAAAGQKLDVSQEARDAFVDRSLGNAKRLEAALAKLSPGERQYAVDLPMQVHAARDARYKADADAYATLDRAIDRSDAATATFVTIRSDAASRCGDANKCSFDPLYREASRWLEKAYEKANMAVEARAVTLALGHQHARRGTAQAQVWSAQMAFRKLHPEVKAPIAITEEDAPIADTPDVQAVRGEIASLAQSHGAVKITLKDPAPWKECADGDIDGFEGALEETRVVYKQVCTDHPAGPKVEPFVTDARDIATANKPGAIVVAAVSPSRVNHPAVIARVIVGDKIVQLGPDKFVTVSGDPLSGKP